MFRHRLYQSVSQTCSPTMKYFVSFAESVLAVPFYLYKGKELSGIYGSYLLSLFEPGLSSIYFNPDIISFVMVAEFVHAVLASVKEERISCPKRCSCSSNLTGLMRLYHLLDRLELYFKQNEHCITECLKIDPHYASDVERQEGCHPDGGLTSWSEGIYTERWTRRCLQGNFWKQLRLYHYPTLSPFELGMLCVPGNELPFLVHDFVTKERYRMVSAESMRLVDTYSHQQYPSKKYFISFSESFLHRLEYVDGTSENFLDLFTTYLRMLYKPSWAMICFNEESVTMSMLGQFVFSVLAESRVLKESKNRYSSCSGTQYLYGVYEFLGCVLDDKLVMHRPYIMKHLLSAGR